MSGKPYLKIITAGIAGGNEMPSLPQIIIQVQKAIMKDSTSVQELAALILDDLSLTGKVLRLANSAYYRRSPQYVSTVSQAIIMLGFGEIQKMVTAISVYDFFSLMTRKNCFRDIWKHSVCTGLCAQRIAISLGLDSPESYLIGGLLHDVGKFVIGQYFPEEYESIIEKIRKTGGKYTEEERAVFQCTHHDVGVLISEHWNLPEEIRRLVRDHDFINKADFLTKNKLTQIVTLSNLVALKTCGFESEQSKIKISTLLNLGEEVLQIKQDALMDIISHISEDIYGLAKILDISIEDLKIDLPEEKTVYGDEEDGESTQLIEPQEAIKRTREENLLELSLKVQETCMEPQLSFKEICREVLTQFRAIISLKFAGVFIKDENSALTPYSFSGNDVEDMTPKLRFPSEQINALSYAVENNKIVLLDAELHKKLPNNALLTGAVGSSKLACFPLTLGKKVIGVLLTVRGQRDEQISQLEKRVITGCVQFMASAYEARKK